MADGRQGGLLGGLGWGVPDPPTVGALMTTTLPLFGLAQTERTSDDYYTPAWVFERMGITFDLDVASPPDPIPWIPAARSYTMADDGLSSPWHGRVWMNPPYSRVTPWWERFAAHGNGVALLPFVKSAWLGDVWAVADGVVIPPSGRVEFSRTDGRVGAVWCPVFFAAFGDECVAAIERIGRVR